MAGKKLVYTYLFFAAMALCSCGKKEDVLLFAGTGTSPNDVIAIEIVLGNSHISYTTVTSAELNTMAPEQITGYKLLIVPGGDFIKIGKGLTAQATTNIHNAVAHGLNYFGICAGAFLAGHSDYYSSFNLTGATFSFYSAENNGVHKAAVAITIPGDSPTLDQYWEDGPQLSGWGAVVAKYPDGAPAVTEGKCGQGLVILSGIHAEAPAGWRQGMAFKTTADVDNAYAASLIRAALNGVLLQHY